MEGFDESKAPEWAVRLKRRLAGFAVYACDPDDGSGELILIPPRLSEATEKVL